MPGMAIQVAAGLIYGWLEGFLMCYFGFVLSNLCVFLFARRMGSDRIKDVSMSPTSQWLMEKLNGTKPQFMVVIACMVPAIPNGIIPYLHGKLAADPACLYGRSVYHQRAVAVHCFDSGVPVSRDRDYPVEERLVFEPA